MRCHWERVGVLGPIYKLAGQGLSDRQIAARLNIPEAVVRNCIEWLMHFLECKDRRELIAYATPAQHDKWGLASLRIPA